MQMRRHCHFTLSQSKTECREPSGNLPRFKLEHRGMKVLTTDWAQASRVLSLKSVRSVCCRDNRY